MAYSTLETSAAEEQCTVKGTHWVKQMVKFWTNYAYWAKDAEATWTGTHIFSSTVTLSGAVTFSSTLAVTDSKLTVGSRTSGSGVDLGSHEEGLLVAAQYTDAATLTNTTDYVGCSAIFDLKLGRAITLASGGGYGFASIWVNLEVDKAINATGGQSAGWFTIWADAAGADAVITGSSRLQVMDLALVTGAAFNAGASTKIYGLRIDSSANASATMSGEFAAINIEAAGTKKDWTIGIDVNNCATGMDIGVCTTNGLVINESDLVVGSRTAGSAVDLGTFETGALIAAQYTDAAALINTTDYVGCAAIVDLKLGRAITLASGGGYGFASLWANLEVDKAINATGGQSTAWMTIWADAAGDDAHIRGTSRLQVLDLAVVTGADFDLGSTAFLYGLRIDSSVNAGATVDGAFRAINIEAAGAKYDWKHGIYMTGVTRGLYALVEPTGASHIKSFEWAVTEATTQSSGYNASFFVEVTNTAAMTPTEYSGGRFNLLLNTGTKTGVINAFKAKLGTGAAPTLTGASVRCFHASVDEIGATSDLAAYYAEMYTTTTSMNSWYLWCRSQGAAQVGALIGVWGTNAPTYFLQHQLSIANSTGYVDGTATAGDQCVGHLALDFGGTPAYINIYSDNS